MSDMATGRGARDTQRQPDDDDEQSVLRADANAHDGNGVHDPEDHDAEHEQEQIKLPRSQPIARFEGLKLRLRNPAADRYLLSVDVTLRLDEAAENQTRYVDDQSQDRDGQLESEWEPASSEWEPASEDEVAAAGAIDGDRQETPETETPETETSDGNDDDVQAAAVDDGAADDRASDAPGVQAPHALLARTPARHGAKPTVKLADVQPDKHNQSVLVVQKALAKAVTLDYSSGPGVFGPRTKAAYARWQRKAGHAGNGTPDLTSLKKLGDKYGFTVIRGPSGSVKGRMPGATWRPIPINHTPGGQQEVRGVVIHPTA